MNDTIAKVKSPETNTPLAAAAVAVSVLLAAGGIVIDIGTITTVLVALVPLVGGVLQWTKKSNATPKA